MTTKKKLNPVINMLIDDFWINLWSHSKRHILSLMSVLISVATAEAYRIVFAKALLPDLSGLLVVAAILLVIQALEYGLQIYQRLFWMKFSFEQVVKLRELLLDKVLHGDLGLIRKLHTEDFYQTLINDVDQSYKGFWNSINTIFVSLAKVIVFLVYLRTISRSFTGAVFAISLIVPGISFLSGRKIKSLNNVVRQKTVKVSSFLSDAIRNLRLVKIYGVEHNVAQDLSGHYRESYQAQTKLAGFSVITDFLKMSASLLPFLVITIYGVRQVISNSLVVSDLVPFILLTNQVVNSVGQIGGSWSNLQRSMVSIERVARIADNKERRVILEYKKLASNVLLEAQNLWHGYEKEHYVLEGASLSINRGETVFLFGPNGVGKSTLAMILTGLLAPNIGNVAVNSTYIDESQMDAIFGYVVSEPLVFTGHTIADNIRIAWPEVSDEELYRVAAVACVTDFANTLEGGLETILTTGGEQLSGGQRQRIGLARAIIRQPQILVLDEALSALDQETEGRVLDGIREYLPNTAIIIISHNKELAGYANRVFIFREGLILQQDTNEFTMLGSSS